MASSRRPSGTFTIWKCARCPEGRTFDMLPISPSGKTTKRSLQYHVSQFHPDYEANWRDLIGKSITRERGSKIGHRQSGVDNAGFQLKTVLDQRSAPTKPQFPQPHLQSVLIHKKANQQHIRVSGSENTPKVSNKPRPVENRQQTYDDLDYNHKLVLLAEDAKNKVSKIVKGIQNDEPVTIGIDSWDQAALDGKLDEGIRDLAKLAFPTDMYYDEHTVCTTIIETALRHMSTFYEEKAKRFEHRLKELGHQ